MSCCAAVLLAGEGMAESVHEDIVTLGRRYRPALMAFFVRRIRNPAEAEDMTQEVLIKLMELSGDTVASPSAYIFRIASNLVRDRHRRLQVRDAWRADVAHREEATADYIDPLRLLEGRETIGQVSRAIAELSQRSREILLLFRLERMRKREIADCFGISVSAVDKHLIKATALLTKRLEEGNL
jgi:RNA polymerase sigma factor (sigma-70 family)